MGNLYWYPMRNLNLEASLPVSPSKAVQPATVLDVLGRFDGRVGGSLGSPILPAEGASAVPVKWVLLGEGIGRAMRKLSPARLWLRLQLRL